MHVLFSILSQNIWRLIYALRIYSHKSAKKVLSRTNKTAKRYKESFFHFYLTHFCLSTLQADDVNFYASGSSNMHRIINLTNIINLVKTNLHQ